MAALSSGESSGTAAITSESFNEIKPLQDCLIIAIDFGTTFSGIAWHHTSSGRTRTITEWPPNSNSSPKVSTALAYNAKDPHQTPKWGFDIPRKPQWKRVEWFKLLLNENCLTTEELSEKIEKGTLNGYTTTDAMNLDYLRAAVQAIPTGKNPIDLVSDYLRALFQHTKAKLTGAYPELGNELAGNGASPLFYLTVPAIWDDKAKDLTKQAAIKAGMGDEARIHMISEPEAAAVHCLKDLQLNPDSIKVGEIYVITDCGGGTVDLISYQVTAVEPLQVKECTIGSGGLCGSTAINRKFEELVQERIGKNTFNAMSHEHIEEMRADFDRLKVDFTIIPEDEDEDDEENDLTCRLPGIADQMAQGIFQGTMRLRYREVKALFEPTFREITKLVQDQVTMAEEACDNDVKAIVLVGGFGGSAYLRQWLEDTVRHKNGGRLSFLYPEYPTLAIVKGAIAHGSAMHKSRNLSGQGPCVGSMIQSRKARFNYGVAFSEPVDPLEELPDNVELIIHPLLGIPMRVGCMSWFVKKGEDLKTNVPIEMNFIRTYPLIIYEMDDKKANDTIYYSDADSPPKFVDDTKMLCSYTVDLSTIPGKVLQRGSSLGFGPFDFMQQFWLAECSILMTFHSASLEFKSMSDGIIIGNVTKDFFHRETETPKSSEPGPHGRHCNCHQGKGKQQSGRT